MEVLDGAVVAASWLQFLVVLKQVAGWVVNAVWQVLKSAYSYCDLNVDKWVEPGEESVPRCTLSLLTAYRSYSKTTQLSSSEKHPDDPMTRLRSTCTFLGSC